MSITMIIVIMTTTIIKDMMLWRWIPSRINNVCRNLICDSNKNGDGEGAGAADE